MSIVINEPQLTELVHEMADARPGRADHLGERFLTDLRKNWFRSAFLSEIGHQQQKPRKSFFGRVEKLRNFTPSDDVLIRQQPVTGISLKRLAEILRTNHAAVRQRATELGVSLVIGDESKGAITTRTLRCSNEFVDPLLERLKDIHGK